MESVIVLYYEIKPFPIDERTFYVIGNNGYKLELDSKGDIHVEDGKVYISTYKNDGYQFKDESLRELFDRESGFTQIEWFELFSNGIALVELKPTDKYKDLYKWCLENGEKYYPSIYDGWMNGAMLYEKQRNPESYYKLINYKKEKKEYYYKQNSNEVENSEDNEIKIPNNLIRFKVYTSEGGYEFHCIPECDLILHPNVGKEDLVCQIPVKVVLKAGYKVEDGYLIAFIQREKDFPNKLIYDTGDIAY